MVFSNFTLVFLVPVATNFLMFSKVNPLILIVSRLSSEVSWSRIQWKLTASALCFMAKIGLFKTQCQAHMDFHDLRKQYQRDSMVDE